MKWIVVGKTDFKNYIRTKRYWFLNVLSGLFVIASVYFFLHPIGSQFSQINTPLTSDNYVRIVLVTMRLIVPLIGIFVGYSALGRDLANKHLRLNLALPNSRLDLMLGKFLSRACVSIAPILIGLIAGAFALIAMPFPFILEPYLVYSLLTLLLGIVFVGIAVGFSGGSATTRRSLLGSFGSYLIFTLFWPQFARNLSILIHRPTNLTRSQTLLFEVVVKHFNPISAYRSLAYRITISGPMTARSVVIPRNLDRSPDVLYLLHHVFYTEVPWYLTDKAVLGYFLIWLVCPLVVGYLLFKSADL